MPAGKVVWVAVEDFAEQRPWCEAPRHIGKHIASQYVLALIVSGEEPYVQAMCNACMTIMADDLGTTPEEGRLRNV